MKTPVTMKQIAASAGVSAMTVSRALQKNSRVPTETRDRIIGIADQLGYVPDQIAASFSSRRSGFVAALVPSLNNPHFSESIRALSETLEAEGLQILIGQTNYLREREADLVSELLRRRPEAIVLTADAHSAHTRRLLANAKVPVVEIWDLTFGAIQHQVGFSNLEAARKMVQFLASRGYRRIAYVGESHDAGSRGARRREGYLQGLQEAEIDQPRIHLQSAPPVTMTEGRAAFHAVRRQWPDTDAIMCVSDPCAFGVMMEATKAGLKVPDDLAIAGFGNFEIGRCCIPPLTTVGVDAFELGLAAAKLLLDRHELSADALQNIETPFELIARGSTR
ncbi:MAG: LacI family DNA-binding transcriptional regulator [Bosea sp. (in: a-proteobacteria)]